MPFAWSWYSREFIETPPIPPGISRTQMFPFDSVRLALPWEVVSWACTSCRPELYPLTSQRGPSRSTKLSANSFWRGACLAKKRRGWQSPVSLSRLELARVSDVPGVPPLAAEDQHGGQGPRRGLLRRQSPPLHSQFGAAQRDLCLPTMPFIYSELELCYSLHTFNIRARPERAAKQGFFAFFFCNCICILICIFCMMKFL